MKKSLVVTLVFVFVFGVAGVACADPFSDVPAKHWAYAAVAKLAKDGVIDGYGDGTFRGDRTMTRYEMAQVVGKAISHSAKADAENKALIQKLRAEFADELRTLGVRVDNLEKRVDKVDKVMLSGYVRAKFDNDKTDLLNGQKQDQRGNRHFYMNLEGTMKVNDKWDAHFQSETNQTYSRNGWGENDGTFQRIWVVGKVGDSTVTMGKKWWGYGQNVIWGHSASGIQVDMPVSTNLKSSVFYFKPTQLGGADSITGMKTLTASALYNPDAASLYGVQLNTDLSKMVNFNLVVGGNGHTVNPVPAGFADATSWGAADFTVKLSDDYTLLATYSGTNANTRNNSQEYRLNYKSDDLSKPGSYCVYLRYFKFQQYGDLSHDDEWGSMPGDAKGWVIGVNYVLEKNLEWSTLYSEQRVNLSGSDVSRAKDASRKLIRTQLDYHF